MADHPLLLFAEPETSQRQRRRGGGGGSNLRFPDARRQGERLNQEFEHLAEAVAQRNMELRRNAVGTLPDQALVLETVGSVENFVNAVRRITGLEWLAESEMDDVEPDEDFHDERDNRPISGRLFLIMTDARALGTLKLRFDNYQRHPNTEFPRGLAPLRHLFRQLRTVRFWGPEDRMGEFGLLDNWRFRLQYGGDTDMLPFEAELWFRNSNSERRRSQERFATLVSSLGGEISRTSIIPEISYHGVLGKVPRDHAAQLVEQEHSQLILAEDVMFLRPAGQWAVPAAEDLADEEAIELPDAENHELASPVVALLDGMPLNGHRLLEKRLVVDDPDDYESYYLANQRQHGTGMASLICYGELGTKEPAIRRTLYVRPILRPAAAVNGQLAHEAIPEEELPVDLVHRAVRRLFEGDADEAAVAPGVRAINLSVCDPRRPFFRDMSPMARLIDWLSFEYQILFLVSAGNHAHDLELSVARDGFTHLEKQEREKELLSALAADTRNRSLLSPAETLNGLTVGAVHSDRSGPVHGSRLIDPFMDGTFPSVISAQGPGYRRAVKPDLLLPGGRQLLSEKLGNTHKNVVLEVSDSRSAPGQRVAWPGEQGSLDASRYTRGTSNATALATRAVCQIFDLLEELRDQSGSSPDRRFDAVLMKALVVHGADCDVPLDKYAAMLNGDEKTRQKKNFAARLVGYGVADVARVMSCTDHRVTVLGAGEIGVDETHTFRLPMPPGVSGIVERRRVITTLAWLSPINCSHRNYRRAQLEFTAGQSLANKPIGIPYAQIRRGTVQHEVREGSGAMGPNAGNEIEIQVSCRADAGSLNEQVRYGLAITIEIPESVNVLLYNEIRDRLAPRARIAVNP